MTPQSIQLRALRQLRDDVAAIESYQTGRHHFSVSQIVVLDYIDDTIRQAEAALPEPRAGTKLVLMSDRLLDVMALTAGKRVTWDWGEPDEHGWYTPTFTEHDDDGPEVAYEDDEYNGRIPWR